MVHASAIAVFVVLFALVTVLGFVAARWRRGDLDRLEEWGLAGRRFGTLVTWFLLGGDLYTAYTFIAVPALVFGAGALGFFAVPYAVMVYPFVFIVMPRLWSVSHKHGYVTGADFVRGRFGSGGLALAIAATGILATMPYIALQLIGIQVVIAALGLQGAGWSADLPLVIAFVILAAYTYNSGLRAPAMIAVVKDAVIYAAVLAAVILIPAQLGGYHAIFESVPLGKRIHAASPAGSLGSFSTYATLAFGSALALFLYPHSLTGVLSASGRKVIQRNAALLPFYTLLLGGIALLGFMAHAAHVDGEPVFAELFRQYGANAAVPALFLHSFPPWFAGFCFAAVAIGALVPAAVMSIAAANLFTRNIYKEFLRPACAASEEARVAKLVSLLVKFGALVFILVLDQRFAIQFQLLGGVWILQTLPAIVLGLYTRRLHRWALLGGWLAGMALGSGLFVAAGFKATFALHLGGLEVPGYIGFWALALNLIVTMTLSPVLDALGAPRGDDDTRPEDYGAPAAQLSA